MTPCFVAILVIEFGVGRPGVESCALYLVIDLEPSLEIVKAVYNPFPSVSFHLLSGVIIRFTKDGSINTARFHHSCVSCSTKVYNFIVE